MSNQLPPLPQPPQGFPQPQPPFPPQIPQAPQELPQPSTAPQAFPQQPQFPAQPQSNPYQQPAQNLPYGQPAFNQSQPAPYQQPYGNQNFGGQPPQQPYQQAPYGFAPQPAKSSNGLALAALITGILGMGIIPIILGFLGLNRSKVVNSGKGLSIAGIILGFLSILMSILLVLIIIPVFANQQKGAIVAGVQSDVKNTINQVATALAKDPSSTNVSGEATGSRGQGTTDNESFSIYASDSNTTVTVSGKWDNYSVVGKNLSLDGLIVYSSSTGQTCGEGDFGSSTDCEALIASGNGQTPTGTPTSNSSASTGSPSKYASDVDTATSTDYLIDGTGAAMNDHEALFSPDFTSDIWTQNLSKSDASNFIFDYDYTGTDTAQSCPSMKLNNAWLDPSTDADILSTGNDLDASMTYLASVLNISVDQVRSNASVMSFNTSDGKQVEALDLAYTTTDGSTALVVIRVFVDQQVAFFTSLSCAVGTDTTSTAFIDWLIPNVNNDWELEVSK